MSGRGRAAPRRRKSGSWLLLLPELVWLWWQGKRDGRCGLPAHELVVAQPALCTPQMQVVLARAQEGFEDEHLWLTAQLEALAVQQHRLVAERGGLQEQLAQAVADVPVPLTAEQLRQRRQGEEQIDPAVVARRRLRAHEAELARRRNVVTTLQGNLQDVEAQLASLPEHASACHEEARVRVQQMAQSARRRISVYQRSLLRRHQEGAALNGVWGPIVPGAPAWAAEPTGRAA